MIFMKSKQEQRNNRHKRIRAKVIGTKDCPRVSVFRSNKYTYVQLIDDVKGNTLLSVSSADIKKKELKKLQIAKEIGILVAKQAIEKEIKKVVFDRGGYKYHGRIKAVAEGARQEGLEF
ncbi:MAG: 50S ribosomal protein L18 [bacterium]